METRDQIKQRLQADIRNALKNGEKTLDWYAPRLEWPLLSMLPGGMTHEMVAASKYLNLAVSILKEMNIPFEDKRVRLSIDLSCLDPKKIKPKGADPCFDTT